MAIKRRASFNPKSFLAKVGEGRSIGEYRKDQIVFSQGDPADAVFYLQRGKAKVTVLSEQGKEAVVAILGTNDFFGEGCLAGQALRIATVATMTDSVIVRLEKAAIVRVIHQEPAFSEMFIAHLLGRTIRVEADLVDQLFNSSEKRLCPAAPAVGELWQGKQTGATDRENQPGDACGDDRHDPVPREFFHEQIPKTGLHSLQRRHPSPQFIVESRSARGAAHRVSGTRRLVETCHHA
jgi:CRP-like cAMP-binding protein